MTHTHMKVKGTDLMAGDILLGRLSQPVIARIDPSPGIPQFLNVTYVGDANTYWLIDGEIDYTIFRPVANKSPIEVMNSLAHRDEENPGALMRLSADVLHSDEEAFKFGMTHRIEYICFDEDGSLIEDTEYYNGTDEARRRALEILAESKEVKLLTIKELEK